MRFIRKNGRVIPVREDRGPSTARKIIGGAAIVGGGYLAGKQAKLGLRTGKIAVTYASRAGFYFQRAVEHAIKFGQESMHYKISAASARQAGHTAAIRLTDSKLHFKKAAVGAAIAGIGVLTAFHRTEKKHERYK